MRADPCHPECPETNQGTPNIKHEDNEQATTYQIPHRLLYETYNDILVTVHEVVSVRKRLPEDF